MLRKRRRAKLIIIGDGPSLPAMKQLAQELQLRSAVEFLGHVDHDRLIAERMPLLGDMFVTASKTENQPMSILEAMSFGLPVVGADSKGIPELVQHEHNGMLFAADDYEQMAKRMLRMSYKTNMTRRMGRNAMISALGFQMPSVADQLENLYAQTIELNKRKQKRV